MNSVSKVFCEHPESVGESYFEHMGMAFGFGMKMLLGGLACLIHGLFPFLCVTRGSETIKELHHCMLTHRDKRASTDPATDSMSASRG